MRITDMMDHIEESSMNISVNIREMEVASVDRVKEATMQKIRQEAETTRKTVKKRKMKGTAMIAAALAATMMLAGSVLAHVEWNGFAYLSGLSKAEKRALSEDATAASTAVDLEGNVHYMDAEGNEIKVVSKEDAIIDKEKVMEEKREKLRQSTDLINVDNLELLPGSITEIETDEKGRFADFALAGGHMVILRPREETGYELQKDDTVTIALNDEEDCILEFGVIKDGLVVETYNNRTQNHYTVFQIKEDGQYNFYIIYYSADKGLFTDCTLTIK